MENFGKLRRISNMENTCKVKQNDGIDLSGLLTIAQPEVKK